MGAKHGYHPLPLTADTQLLHGPPTPSFSHRSRSLSLGVVRDKVTSMAVGVTAVTGPHSCCSSTASTASSVGAGVVSAIRTTMREPSMATTAGGLGATADKSRAPSVRSKAAYEQENRSDYHNAVRICSAFPLEACRETKVAGENWRRVASALHLQ
jgi:hypothetical protein